MTQPGKILMADDEQVFLKSTTALLGKQGYECDSVPDGLQALERLQKDHYDLLIADIMMPGNTDLEMINALPKVAQGMPVIMVTGYPSLESAIQSIELPIVAYLVKPVDFEELLTQVKIAVEYSRTFRVLDDDSNGNRSWRLKLEDVRQAIKKSSGESTLPGVDAFLTMKFRNIVADLGELKQLTDALVERREDELLGPDESQSPLFVQNARLLDAVFETIAVLERSKDDYRSEDINTLREKLKNIARS